MANIAFKDTGYAVKPSPINTTPEGSTFDQVNSGNEIVLQGVSVNCTIGSNPDNTNVPALTGSNGFFEGPEINTVSASADQFTITGLVDRSVSADMTQLGYLRQLIKSKGIKMFYYSSATDGYRDMTDTWGETTTAYATQGGFTSGTTLVLFVLCTKIIIKHTADSKKLRYTMTMLETSS